LGPGQVPAANILPYYDVTHKKTKPKNHKKHFLLQTQRLAKFF